MIKTDGRKIIRTEPTNTQPMHSDSYTTKVEPPYSYNSHNIVHWEPESKKLLVFSQYMGGDPVKLEIKKHAKSWLAKAGTFLDNKCIEKKTRWKYICKPLDGYNKTTYSIFINQDPTGPEMECNCQGFQTKIQKGEEPFCSHCLAVKQFIHINQHSRAPPERISRK